MGRLSPEQREQLTVFLADAGQIERSEYHFRRTDRLIALSVVLLAGLMTVVALNEAGVVAAVATGLLFPLGLAFGAMLITARQRRRAYAQVSTLREIAELTLLFDDD